MRIEVRAWVAAQIKQPCVSCGMWDRPGEPAYFLITDGEEWICEQCVEGGEERVREGFRKRAEQHRRIAASYDELLREEIAFPDPGDWEEAGREVERYWEEEEEKAKAANSNDNVRHLRPVRDPNEGWGPDDPF